MQIGNFQLGNDSNRTFIIAELSANHNQDFDVAVKTIKAIKDAGADCIKIQTYTPDTITLRSDAKWFKIEKGTIWDGKTLYDLYAEAYTPWEWQPRLQEVANDLGLIFFSSPFDFSSVDFLEKLNVPAYKIASFEITDIPLIEYVASKKKPVIISTGIANLADIELAVNACKKTGNDQIALLKCTSSYPAPYGEINLRTMVNLRDTFGTVIGLSDHTMGGEIPVAAVAMGARIVEKHFILDRSIGGPDSNFSMEPEEFRMMVQSIRNTEKALGKITYELSESTVRSREFSRSIFVSAKIEAGTVFSQQNIRSVRPGNGLHPRFMNEILGKKALRPVEAGTPLSWDMVEIKQ